MLWKIAGIIQPELSMAGLIGRSACVDRGFSGSRSISRVAASRVWRRGFKSCLKASENTNVAPHSRVLMHWQYKSYWPADNRSLDVISAFPWQCGQFTRTPHAISTLSSGPSQHCEISLSIKAPYGKRWSAANIYRGVDPFPKTGHRICYLPTEAY